MEILKKMVVIILNYNTPELTINLTNKLISWGCTVIVVDNASTDESFKRIEDEYKDSSGVCVLETNCNMGYASGNNFGIEYACNKISDLQYITIANPDIELINKDSIEKMLIALENDDSLAGITAMTILNNEFIVNNPCASRLLKAKELVVSDTFFLKGLINSKYDKFVVNDKNVAYVDKIQGCFFIMKKDIFSQIGFFDSNTFLYFEEDIIACKIKQLGKRMGVLVTEFIKHNHINKDKEMNTLSRRIFYNKCTLSSKKYYMKEVLKTGRLIWAASYILDFFSRKIKDIYLKVVERL